MSRSDWYSSGVTNCFVWSGVTASGHYGSGVSYYTGYPLITYPRINNLTIKVIPETTVYLKETTQPSIIYRDIIKKEVMPCEVQT